MEALLSQFTFLSDQALSDKNFDPSAIEDLMKLFELEAYNAWAVAALEADNEARDAEISLQEAESYLDSVMDDAVEDFRRFEAELDGEAAAELRSLVETAEAARRMGRSMENAATAASNRYIEAALNSATATMKKAWKGLSGAGAGASNSSKVKVHPS